MTNEEREKAIEAFEYQIKRSEDVKCGECEECYEWPFEDYCIKDVAKWLSLALEALKQKPCEDAVNRKALMSHIENEAYRRGELYDLDQVLGDIKNFPPVTLTREHGEWIEHKYAEEVDGRMISNYECSLCHSWKREATDYCPCCGADMRKEQK